MHREGKTLRWVGQEMLIEAKGIAWERLCAQWLGMSLVYGSLWTRRLYSITVAFLRHLYKIKLQSLSVPNYTFILVHVFLPHSMYDLQFSSIRVPL